LAYSSVEHMGILSVGAALGVGGLVASLFHVWSNSITKGALFLSAGNMRRAAGSSRVPEATGMVWLTPVSARVFAVGVFAITACPPFGPFFSELQVVRAASAAGQTGAMFLFLGCLLLAFLGLTRLAFSVLDGRPRRSADASRDRFRETAGILVPPLVFLAASLWLGLATPEWLRGLWDEAARTLTYPG
ncbi:MAG TPA: proton-conducting transporter membrane subunit, partial [Verrucomicrobiota bacterium]|nr:proton-conducting transporter membrane subunit [Verrucomicrobiota bacterium]